MKSFLASQSLLFLGRLKVSNRVYNVDIIVIIINATEVVFHWYFYVLSQDYYEMTLGISLSNFLFLFVSSGIYFSL